MNKVNNSGLPIGPEYPWLAPLAGYTDLPFRLLCREGGAAVAVTEMISAKGLVYSAQARKGSGSLSSTEELLATTPLAGFPANPEADRPLVAQLFGQEPEFLAQAAELVLQRGFTHIDLNMGCSVPKVVKAGAGAALLKDVEHAVKVGKALTGVAGPGRVGFKLRLGWDRDGENYLELAQRLQDAGAGWITLHPRYARQGFSGQADWQALLKLAACLQIPLIASGDLFTAQDALRCLEESRADGVMFARGALHNPAIFNELKALYAPRGRQGAEEAAGQATEGAGPCAGPCAGSCASSCAGPCASSCAGPLAGSCADACAGSCASSYSGPTVKARILRHAELMRAFDAALLAPARAERARRKEGPERLDGALVKMRGIVPRYLHNFPGAKALRASLTQCRAWDEFYTLIEDFFSAQIDKT